MSLYKRGKLWHMDATINGVRYREALETTDGRKAKELERKRIAQLEKKPDPKRRSASFGALDVKTAIKLYIERRQVQVSPRMCVYWDEQSRPLAKHFGELKLKKFTPDHLIEYQNARLCEGRAPKTINGEVSVLRQLLKHAKLWYR